MDRDVMSPTVPRGRRRWLGLSWPEWLVVASIALSMYLFMLATTYYELIHGGCHTALELTWWGWWIQPLQPFVSLVLGAGPMLFAYFDGKKHERRRPPVK